MLRSDPVSYGAWGPLDKLEAQSICIFRELFNKVDKVAMLWSFGKDSNVMIHLARKAFFGRVPFPLIHCETELEMDEVYQFRDRYAKEWGIVLISELCPSLETTDPSLPQAASTTTTGLRWRLHPAFAAGGAASLVGTASPFVA